MKIGLRYARLSAAIVAVLYGASAAHARNLTWDASGANPPTDGSGNWNTTSSNWYDPTANAVTTFSSANPDSATFGTGAPVGTAAPGFYNITLTSNITAQDIILGDAANGSYYNIVDAGDGLENLTLDGNLIKSSANGTSVIQLTNALNLSAGNHTVAINDTSGPVPELAVDNAIAGAGSLTLNNAFNSSGYTQYGTFVLNVDNSYTGGTNIVDGALTVNSQGALGSGTATISNQGVLAFGGNGTVQPASMNITTPIVITRNTYSGTNFGDYPDAIISSNTGNSANTVTFSGPFTVDSTDARISANTSTIVISSNIQQGPDVTNGVLTVDGDFAGFVTLTGNNTALVGGIQLIGGVELNVSNQNNLGGASSPLTFAGSATLHPIAGFMTGFGTHVLNNATFSGGIDVDSGQQFTIDQALGDSTNKGGSLGKRGLGTLNINSPVNLQGGQSFFDSGIVNVNNSVTLGSLHLRSPVVNIGTGGSVTTTNGYSSFGQDSTGTNGGPDMATVNLTGTGSLTLAAGNDFNVSDNNNTSGTINIQDSAVLTVNAGFFIGKSTGATGTINQSGGTVNSTNGGGNAFDLGQGNATGIYTMTGGALNIAGEMWVGNQGGSGSGTFTQSGGATTVGSWFVVGRQGGVGNLTLSGGTLTRTNTNGGNNNYIGETNAATSTMTVEGTGVATFDVGQFWVGESGKGVLNVSGAGSFTTNDWFAIGRNGGTGTVNLSGGTITKQGNNFLTIGSGGGASGTVIQTGGTLNSDDTYIGEGGNGGAYNISAGAANFTGALDVGQDGGTTGMLSISGTGAVTAQAITVGDINSVSGTINLNGGSLTAASIAPGTSTGTQTLNFNGGTLLPSASTATFMSGLTAANVQAGGAIVNTNGAAITIGQALLGSAGDGGLTVSGAGALTLTGANTYNGATKVNGGDLVIGAAGALPANNSVSVTGGTLQFGTGVGLSTLSSLTISSGGIVDVTNNHLIINYTGSDPASTIRGYLATGYNGGKWNGPGIDSSTAAVNPNYGVGFADGADHVVAGLSSGQLEVKYTLYGDVNLDGEVNGTDFGILASNFGKNVTGGWEQGDFTYSGKVNATDFGLLAANFGKTASGTAIALPASDWAALDSFAQANGLLANVPEPASISLLAVGGLCILRRRRRV